MRSFALVIGVLCGTLSHAQTSEKIDIRNLRVFSMLYSASEALVGVADHTGLARFALCSVAQGELSNCMTSSPVFSFKDKAKLAFLFERNLNVAFIVAQVQEATGTTLSLEDAFSQGILVGVLKQSGMRDAGIGVLLALQMYYQSQFPEQTLPNRTLPASELAKYRPLVDENPSFPKIVKLDGSEPLMTLPLVQAALKLSIEQMTK